MEVVRRAPHGGGVGGDARRERGRRGHLGSVGVAGVFREGKRPLRVALGRRRRFLVRPDVEFRWAPEAPLAERQDETGPPLPLFERHRRLHRLQVLPHRGDVRQEGQDAVQHTSGTAGVGHSDYRSLIFVCGKQTMERSMLFSCWDYFLFSNLLEIQRSL